MFERVLTGIAMNRSTVGNPSEISPDSGSLVRRILTGMILFAAVALTCLVLYIAVVNPDGVLPRPFGASSTIDQTFSFHTVDSSPDDEETSLERILKAAAMEDGTVILTTLNEAWAAPGSIIDLFIDSFRVGDRTSWLLKHLVVVALDQEAYTRCLVIHTHCFALVTQGSNFTGEAYFMTSDYLEMMWRRIDFLRSVLEMGYHFIFTDADIMWFRNPFPHFYPDADFQIACDNFMGNPSDLSNRPNGGFNYVKSNKRTIEFYKFWYSSRETHPGYHDQDVLNMIKFDPFITQIGLKMMFLDTAYFGGFCEPSRDLNLVCTMHANCCYGLDSKLIDLRIMIEDWRKYVSSPPNMKASSLQFWRVPHNCSLSSFHPPPKKKQQEQND
ncbi:PREDICTED: uncharacterized protein At4g15970-like [Nelumbo nucifera]|uniref:Glycosyltransferase n=2 Tax=Nelumbo nucifera TaxID=4432 RepID=A0A1U8Q408_NELNU|nr:PREDICTED: uncharacterized protein At4g15970-like [Nelumbo nucifera]XP_019053558.1 PREDICTED: uncharacterized protein At4g15970-like [Nelumbo nucifera]DAD38051.1 TPA_asm: hypothetical protein HUJ06_008692 [Nelumbo nucifera]